jgi:hypothetical protein
LRYAFSQPPSSPSDAGEQSSSEALTGDEAVLFRHATDALPLRTLPAGQVKPSATRSFSPRIWQPVRYADANVKFLLFVAALRVRPAS